MNDNQGLAKEPIPMPESFDVLQIGITTVCNQLCAHCTRDDKRKGMSTMTLEQFEHYLDQFEPKQFKNLLLSDFGEITIISNCLDYLRAAKRRGFIGKHFVTNASVKKPGFWKAIADEQLLDFLIISLEAAEDPLYDYIRGQSFEHFKSVVEIIVNAFSNANNKIPIILNAVCMKKNFNQLSKITEFACAIGAAELSFVHLNSVDSVEHESTKEKLWKPEHRLDNVERSEVIATFREVLNIASKHGLRVQLPENYPELVDVKDQASQPAVYEKPPLIRCNRPNEWIQVGLDGSVFPCCQILKRYAVGNLQRSSFQQMWTDKPYTILFDGLRPGNKPLDVCQACNMLNGKRF